MSAFAATIRQKIKLLMLERDLKQTSLAELMKTRQSHVAEMLSGKRSIGLSMLGRFAKALQCDKYELLGIDRAHSVVECSSVESDFIEVICAVLGGPIEVGTPVPTSRLLMACEELMPQFKRAAFGKRARHLHAPLEFIISVAAAGYQQGVSGGKDLLFDAKDTRVVCDIVLLQSNQLRSATALHLRDMAALVEEGKPDRALQERYFARQGEIDRLSDDPAAITSALQLMENGRALGGRKPAAGYHCIRSVPILAAKCKSVTNTDFDKAVSRAKVDIENATFTPHDRVFAIDGLAEANALRYKLTRQRRYKTAALQQMELAQRQIQNATTSDGDLALCSLRIAKLPVILGQSGILDHFAETRSASLEKLHEEASQVLCRATEIGCDRTVEQMSKVVLTAP